MSTQDPIDQLFRDSAEEYAQQPAARSWRRIERRIDRRRRSARPRPQLGWARAVAAMLLVGLTTVGLLQLEGNSKGTFAQQAEEVHELLPTSNNHQPSFTVDYEGISEGDESNDFTARFVERPQLQPARAFQVKLEG